jgi:LuxR family maltose regulon positive regulatory protein
LRIGWRCDHRAGAWGDRASPTAKFTPGDLSARRLPWPVRCTSIGNAMPAVLSTRAGPAVAVFPQTKFHRPSGRAEHVERALLLGAIEASRARIVVVTAPPGFGKSTLLAQWSARCEDPERVAWVSLDADDAGARLWSAVLTGLRELLGPDLDAALDAAEAPDADLRSGVLIALLDALALTREPITLVLDDLHLVLADAATCESLGWLLARLPEPHRVLLATRRELGLDALGRLRIQGDVLDLRADDLRFADHETQRFLRDRLGLELDADDVAALERRTEGWPAALYLAALRLRLGDDVADLMAQLGDSGEDLFGALTDEVLRSSPEHERRFILETSVLDRFNADLCARVLGDDATTRGAFRTLTRTSLLLSPLDRRRTWFRCHHCCARCCTGGCWRSTPSARGRCTCAPARGSRPRAARASCTRRCTTTSRRRSGTSRRSC